MADNTPRIVVGYDGSHDADSALDWAARSAAVHEQPLEVVVVATDMDPVVGHYREHDDETAERLRTSALDRLKDLEVVHGTVEVRHGPVVPQLITAAEGAEMLVVGSRGHGLAMGSLAGSVSQHAARHAPCPVVAVRPCRSPDASRIVVGVDGSPESEKALRFAGTRALSRRPLSLSFVPAVVPPTLDVCPRIPRQPSSCLTPRWPTTSTSCAESD
jgi:nucleotide-binding universal stress UspA family protein